ncbi:hypothetical protein CBR_g36870 [Chara braunii]|uniref:Uncharacterized protein n=1 Tax=Chara braunii TaxID=69332 RepID=A0A388LM00_CHABU|nr:hypothetical protein CBR_g36870 [Chara braunii]|eukprot:GBG83255.1 hypothetical protein CBR_g36870 [Chara braunii]
MFEEGQLPIGDSKIPLDMSGRMEGRLTDPYSDEIKGQRSLYHCIYARDGPKGSTVSWKDLCPSYFKNFGDMICHEREVALLLLMKEKLMATNVKVTPLRVNTECLLDIMRKERYMVRMFNYVVFRTDGRADDEWNDNFFMSYKDQEERYAPNGLRAAEWEKEREKLHSNKAKTVPRRLGGVEEARQGTGLGPTEVMYKEAPFRFKVFIYTVIDKLDLLRANVKRIASSTRHLVWDKLGRQTTLLLVCMRSKEVMAAPDDIVASAQKMACRAAIVDISAANFSSNNVIACDESAKDISYLTKFIDILVKDDRFNCRLEKPRSTHRNNRDMYHKLGPKRLKVWEYLFRDAPEGRLDESYIYKKAKVTEALKHYNGALTDAFETFVARCEILKFDLHKDQLTFKDYADLAKSGEGFNPVDSKEDSSDSELKIENDTNAAGWRGQSAAMERDDREYGPGRSEGCSNPPPANSVASMVDRVACTPIEDGEDDEIDIPDEATKLAPGDPIPPNFCADPNNMCFLDDKYARTSEDKWGHDIIWHDDIFEPCIQGGEWKMAVKYVSGWRLFARLGKDSWLKTTEAAIYAACGTRTPGRSKPQSKQRRKNCSMPCESVNRTTDLRTTESMEVDSREDVALLSEAATGNTKGEQREDVGTTSGMKAPLPEVGNTSTGEKSIITISVTTVDRSQGGHVSLDKPSEAGATYGSLLATGAEMESEGMSLHPPSCTSKGDADQRWSRSPLLGWASRECRCIHPHALAKVMHTVQQHHREGPQGMTGMGGCRGVSTFSQS